MEVHVTVMKRGATVLTVGTVTMAALFGIGLLVGKTLATLS